MKMFLRTVALSFWATAHMCAAAQKFDDALLFKASFDGFSAVPDHAAAPKLLRGSIAADLQLRMHDDVGGGRGNALTLTTPEAVVYPVDGNFRPDRGTVSFWIKPLNYDLAEMKYFQMMFRVAAKDFSFIVDKYYPKSNQITFGINVAGRFYTVKGKAVWREGDWHKIDVTWDPGSMALYIDGLPAPGSVDSLPAITIDPPLEFPKALTNAVMGLNYAPGWKHIENGRITAFDELEIRSRKLSAKEIFDSFRRKRPDLAAGKKAARVDEDDSPRVSYKAFPREGRLSVKIDLGNVKLKRAKDIPVELRLLSRADGRQAAAAKAVLAEPDSAVDFRYGAVEEGREYDVVVNLPEENISAKAGFRACRLDFLRERAGVDNSVPSPWHPVRRSGALEFEVLDRRYVFSRGIFPESAESRGRAIFARRMELVFNGAPVEWNCTRIKEERHDRVVLAATGSASGVDFGGEAELWFDGFLKLRFAMRPQNGEARDVSSLRLKYALKDEAAKYILAPSFKPWRNGAFSGRFGTGRNDLSLLWLTGPEAGLAWWCESRANWSTSGDDVRVDRSGDAVEVEIDIIAKPERLREAASYTMALQATPNKRPDRLYRVRFNARSAKAPANEGDWSSCGWASHSGVSRPDNIRHWTSLVPTHPSGFSDYLKERKASGRDIFVYSMPLHISPLDPPWDMFSGEWLKSPGIRWDFVDETTRRRSHVVPCCGVTGAADWHAANAKRLFETQPLLFGVYYDISSIGDCTNARHGHGGVDSFGRAYATSTALGMREYFLRILKLCRAYSRRFQVHAHNLYFPFIHSLADSCSPGEEQYSAYIANPRHHYQEGIPAEEYESAFNSDVMGMNVYFIPQNARALALQPEIVKPRIGDFVSDEAVVATIMPSLVYDFQCKHVFGEYCRKLLEIRGILKTLSMEKAKFTGYWQTGSVRCAKDVRAGLYRWRKGEGKYAFMLAVGNFGREDAATGLAVDWDALGLKRPENLVDLLSGETIGIGDLAAKRISSHGLKLLVGEYENEREGTAK